MAFVIDQRDCRLRYEGIKRREYLVTALLSTVLVFFCGLRTWGNDTVTYLEIYEYLTPVWGEITPQNTPEFSSGIGLFYISSMLKKLGFTSQDYLMFFALITIIPYVLFVRRYSRSMVSGVFLMFATGFYTFTLAAIKQCVATGICLLALDYALDKKWIRYCLMIGLAMLFHPYALVYFLVPLVMFKPWSYRTLLYTGIFVTVGFYLDSLIGTVLDITTMMGAEYTEESFTGEGVNIFRVAVSFVPMLLAALYGKKMFRNSDKTDDLMFNLAMLNALIMFVGLFGTANYFARLANYFLPAQVIVLPWMLGKAHPRDKAWLIPACIAGYLGYFIYEHAIIRPFDTNYSHMPFWDYILNFV
jgi:hypothetical protein